MTLQRAYERFAVPASCGLLFALNVYIAHRLFLTEFKTHLETNEGSFIAIARVMAANPRALLWWPLWDLGMPFQYTYFPLTPALAAAWSRIGGVSPALALHQVGAFFYCLGPVTLFLMAWTMSKRVAASFFAALAYSLLSPCAWFFPMLRPDMGGSVWNARRLQILSYYGEDPHITTVAFLPLAVMFLYLALKRGGAGYFVLGVMATAAVMLSNAFGTVNLILMCACVLAVSDHRRFGRNAALLAAAGAAAYLWVSPAIPPSLLQVIRANAPLVGGDYQFTSRSLLGLAILAAGAALLWLAARRARAPEYLSFFLLSAWVFFAIPALAFYFDIFVFPQPHRYQVEMEMGFCLVLAFGGRLLLQRMPRAVNIAVLLLLLAFAFRQTVHSVRYARRLIVPVEIQTTPEYKVAHWADQHMQGKRMFVSGQRSFWFNVFTDVAQMHGGHDPNTPNFLVQIAHFVIGSGMNTGSKDVEISLLWLRALGVSAIHVPLQTPEDYYVSFANPHKFEGVLPVLWREDGETIYQVPRRSDSLAHVVPESALAARRPVNGIDIAPLIPYVQAMEDPSLPLAKMEWHGTNSFVVRTSAARGEAISVQTNYFPGWRAMVNGRERRVYADALGLMAIAPKCNGSCVVELNYDGGPERTAALAASWLVTLSFVGFGLSGATRRLGYIGRRP